MEPQVTISLTITEINTILMALDNLPHKQVVQLIPKIGSQAQAQVDALNNGGGDDK